MTKTDQLLVQVYFVPLPAIEVEERRERLRGLLLRGSIRVVQRQALASPATMVCVDGELAQK